MPTVTPRILDFEISVDRNRAASSGLGGAPIAAQEQWWAEHLLLAALVRCTLASMDYAAHRAGLEVSGSGEARGTVTKRDEDGLYAFVEVETSLEIELEPPQPPESVQELVAKAERGCFVGSSLVAKPQYHWTVNGEEVR